MSKKTFTLISNLYCWILAIIFFGLALHAPFSVFFGHLLPDLSLFFKSWKEILLIFDLCLVIPLFIHARPSPHLFKMPIIRLLLAYIILNLLFGLFSVSLTTFLAGFVINLRFFLSFFLVLVALRLRPDFKERFLKSALAGAVIVLTFGILQAFILPANVLSPLGYGPDTILPYQTIDQNPDFVRINSTLRGPNPLGAYSLLPLLFGLYSITSKPRSRRRLALSLFLIFDALVCLVASFSRSALLAAALASAAFLIYRFRAHLKPILFSFAALGIILFATLLIFRDAPLVKNLVFHNNPDSSSSIKSDDDHSSSLGYAISRILAAPLGHGTGSANSASLLGDSGVIIENYYLSIAYEIGIFGLAIFAIILVLLFRALLCSPSPLARPLFFAGLGLLLINFFLPTFSDETVAMTFFGLIGIVCSYETHQKATHSPRLYPRLHSRKPNQP
jgi:hypothetical protein